MRDAAFVRALKVLELCMGDDLRENGCACKPALACYLHAVTVPDAIRDLRSALAAAAPLSCDEERSLHAH